MLRIESFLLILSRHKPLFVVPLLMSEIVHSVPCFQSSLKMEGIANYASQVENYTGVRFYELDVRQLCRTFRSFGR